MFDIKLDTSILGTLDSLAEQVDEAKEVGLNAVAERGLELKKSNVSVLTGAWRDGQDIESEAGVRRIVDTGPAAEPITNYPGGYAQRLATLNSPRRNNAAETTHNQLQTEAQDIFEEAVRKHLG